MDWRCQDCRRILHRNKSPFDHLRSASPQSSFASDVEGCTSVRVFFRRAAMAANCKSHQRLRKYDGDFEPDPGGPGYFLWECIPSTLQTISRKSCFRGYSSPPAAYSAFQFDSDSAFANDHCVSQMRFGEEQTRRQPA